MAVPDSQDDRLLGLEQQAARMFHDFIEVGLALGEIRDDKLFRVAGYSSFTTYLRERLGIGRSTAHQKIVAASVAIDLSARADTRPLRLTERHLALLYRFDRDTRALVARQIVSLSIRQATVVVLEHASPSWRLSSGRKPPPRHVQEVARRAWRLSKQLEKYPAERIAFGLQGFTAAERREALDDFCLASRLLQEVRLKAGAQT